MAAAAAAAEGATGGGGMIAKHFSNAGSEEDGAEIVASLWQSWDEASCSLQGSIASSSFLLPACEDELMEHMPLERAVLETDCLYKILRAKVVRDETGRPLQAGPLYPVITEGDGDCLLHATSLSLFGRHDRGQVFRQMIALLMTSEAYSGTIKQIWVNGEKLQDEAIGIEREQKILDEEYAALVDMTTKSKEHLAAFHIFCLAHVLRRPIIVFADRYVRTVSGTPFAPASMRGIYLPVLIDPESCCKQPITLVYTVATAGAAGHFTAAVGMEEHTSHIQLFDEAGMLLPVPYSTTADEAQKLEQLREYLDLQRVVFDAEKRQTGLVARVPRVTKMLPAVRRMREQYLLQVMENIERHRRWLQEQLDSANRQEELLRSRLDQERRQLARYDGWDDSDDWQSPLGRNRSTSSNGQPPSSSHAAAATGSSWSPIHRSSPLWRNSTGLAGAELQRLQPVAPAARYKPSSNNHVPVHVRHRHGHLPHHARQLDRHRPWPGEESDY